MIYTVTFNPSLDYVVDVKTFKTGQVNRTEQEKMFPGGKGINVSIVLNHLGLKSTAWGFLAGFTGEEISKRLDEEGVNTDFIQVEKGISRIQWPGADDPQHRYREALCQIRYLKNRRCAGTGRKHTGCYATVHIYGYHEIPGRKGCHDCRRCNQRTSGKCTSASSIPD